MSLTSTWKRLAVDQAECLGHRARGQHLGPAAGEHATDQLARVGLVVDDQHGDASSSAGGEVHLARRRLLAAGSAGSYSSSCTTSRGNETLNVLPWSSPGLLARTLPPCISTSCLTIDRPSPRPPCRRVVEPSAWRNRSKTNGRNSGLIPMPVSVTVISTCELTRSSRTWIRPASGRELHRVGEQVPDDLLEPRRVARDRAGQRVEDLDDADALGLGGRQDRRQRRVDDLGQAHPLDVQAELAGDDPREVEQVLDELGLDLGVAVDGVEALLDVVGRRACRIGAAATSRRWR